MGIRSESNNGASAALLALRSLIFCNCRHTASLPWWDEYRSHIFPTARYLTFSIKIHKWDNTINPRVCCSTHTNRHSSHHLHPRCCHYSYVVVVVVVVAAAAALAKYPNTRHRPHSIVTCVDSSKRAALFLSTSKM